jgi:biopolymer transport protein ExbD
MRRHRRELRPVADINLTSLLDVSFVLLIAFMIVAPSLKYGIQLDLPTIKEGAPQLNQNQQQLFTITLPKPKAGTQDFLVNDSPAQLRDIEERLRLQKQQGRQVAVEINADKDVPYETFIEVVAAVRRAGVEAVGLPVEASAVSGVSPAASASPTPAPAGAK